MGEYLLSSISVSSRIQASLAEVKLILSHYPSLKLMSYGTSLRYLSEEESENIFYTLDFAISAIKITIHSKDSPIYYTSEALLRLLAMLSVMEGVYEPDIRGIYPYLILALGESKLQRLTENLGNGESPNSENSTDILLARRINWLAAENRRLAAELAGSKAMSESILSKFIILHYGTEGSLERLSKETGLDRSQAEKALSGMGRLGYKLIRNGKDRYSLVRL